ncbi:MAG: hypothetical protein P4L22_00110 [Candidatus Babeliales bacterium]|nr:hypothetical protein [Candidatus Babeliales bacterium]
MININIYKLFNRSIKWNTIEAVVYQAVLTAHHIFLFSAVDKLNYALIGTVFSLLYLTIVFLNLGLDKSLATFFVDYTKTKANFKKYFLSQLFLQVILLVFVGLIGVMFKDSISCLFSSNFKCPTLESSIWIIIALLLLSESLKKTFRTFAQLAFLNKQTTSIEICAIILYFATVWGYYLITAKISLLTILVPFVLESLISNIFLLIITYNYYKTISQTELAPKIAIASIVSNRFFVYINQISHMFFSGNFIIPFLASIYSLEHISTLKLTNNIAVFITVLMERIFGITSAALLTHVKFLQISDRRQALNISTSKLYNILYAIIIFLIINFKFLSSYKIAISDMNWMPIYLFLALLIFENFFITYEQYLIVEGKSYYLMFINSISALLFYIILDKTQLSLSEILGVLIAIRISSFLLLRLICYLILSVNLPYKIKLKHILFYILTSLLFLTLCKLVAKIT